MRSQTTLALGALLFSPALSSPVQTFPDLEQWPVASVGQLLQPQLPDADLQSILSEISVANIEATIRKLASFGTRHTLSSQDDPNRGIGAARDWLTLKYREAAEASEGRMSVSWNSFIKQPGDNERILFPVNITSVVATLEGSEDPDRLYVVGGHYDSRNSDPVDYEGDAPGAVDECVCPTKCMSKTDFLVRLELPYHLSLLVSLPTTSPELRLHSQPLRVKSKVSSAPKTSHRRTGTTPSM